MDLTVGQDRGATRHRPEQGPCGPHVRLLPGRRQQLLRPTGSRAWGLDKIVPGTRGLAINNRKYLVRVVDALATEYGIRQFIDIGTGLPTMDNVHQVARRAHPDARGGLRRHRPHRVGARAGADRRRRRTAFILQDVRRTEEILNHPDTRRLIDFSQPVLPPCTSASCTRSPTATTPLAWSATMMTNLVPGSFVAIVPPRRP